MDLFGSVCLDWPSTCCLDFSIGDQICPAKAGDGEKDQEDGGWGPQWEVFVEYLDVTTIC